MPKPNKCDNSRTLSNSTSDDSDDEYLSALTEAVDPTLHSTLYNQSESQTVKFQGNILFYLCYSVAVLKISGDTSI